MQWEVVIGLETHVQLSTESKIFSGASTHFGAEANTQACYIDLALPGALPVLNRGAVERGAKFGFAIGAEVAERSVFDRKNYFYPDLPKGYQISQFDNRVWRQLRQFSAVLVRHCRNHRRFLAQNRQRKANRARRRRILQ